MISMEKSLGLDQLSPIERDVYCAANELAATCDQVKTTSLIAHDLMADVSRPTFFRALKSLVDKGYLSSRTNAPRGSYMVNERPDTA